MPKDNKDKKQCQDCKKAEEVPGKDYILCQRSKKNRKGKNPYRHFDDGCPGYEVKQ